MTKRKKWPHAAEWARQDNIALWGEVRRQIRTAQHLVLSSPTEAILILGQAADKTVDGENILRQAKDAES